MMTLLQRLVPAPWQSAGLLVLSLLLARSASTGQWLLGAAIALGVPHIMARLAPERARPRRPMLVLRFLVCIAGDVVLSNLVVARDVLVRWRRPSPGFVVIPLELRDSAGLAALAWVTTIVPGTVWSELAVDRHALLLHVWHVDDEVAFVQRFKARYERPLREIFE